MLSRNQLLDLMFRAVSQMQSTQWLGAVVVWLFLFVCYRLCFPFSDCAKDIVGDMPAPKRKERMTAQFHSYLNPKCDSGRSKRKADAAYLPASQFRKAS